jgi:monovalent cation:H+ antiporter-2, CPA2 family
MIEKELVTLVLLFVFAIIGGILAARFRQPIVLGLLLVGTLIGPFALNLVNDAKMIDMMIELGAILLLFVVGMEFSAKKLLNIGAKALIVTIFKVGITFFLGYEAAVALGLGIPTGIFIGIILSFTSTVVVVKILEQKEMIKRSEVPLLLAVLIIEDIVAVVALTLLSGIKSSGGTGASGIIEHLLISIAVLIIVYAIIAKYADNIVALLLKHSNEEMITFIGLALCAGFAYLAYVLGISPSAGAFLAGSIIHSVKDSKSFGKAIMPHSLMFSSLFFIAIGTLIDLRAIVENYLIILALLGILIITRFAAVGFSTYLFGNMRRDQPIFSCVAMISVGEFSLLIAKEAGNFGITIDLVTITAILIFISSIIMSFGVKHTGKVHTAMSNNNPGRFKRKMNLLGNFIGSFLEQLDTESTFTNRFKIYASKTMQLFIVFLFVLVGAHKLVGFLKHVHTSHFLIYAAILSLSAIAVFVLYLVYYNGREVYHLSVKISANIDRSMNEKRADKTLRYITIGLLIIVLGFLAPVVVFIAGWSAIWSLIPVAIVIIGLYVLSRAFRLLGSFSQEYMGKVQKYEKYNPDLERFKRGGF